MLRYHLHSIFAGPSNIIANVLPWQWLALKGLRINVVDRFKSVKFIPTQFSSFQFQGLFNFGVQSKIWWVTKFGKNDWNPSIGWPNEHLTPKKCFEQPPASENSINRSKILLFTKSLIFERIFQMLSQPYTTLKYGVSYTVGKV